MQKARLHFKSPFDFSFDSKVVFNCKLVIMWIIVMTYKIMHYYQQKRC